jgi:hypothetical protein
LTQETKRRKATRVNQAMIVDVSKQQRTEDPGDNGLKVCQEAAAAFSAFSFATELKSNLPCLVHEPRKLRSLEIQAILSRLKSMILSISHTKLNTATVTRPAPGLQATCAAPLQKAEPSSHRIFNNADFWRSSGKGAKVGSGRLPVAKLKIDVRRQDAPKDERRHQQ